MKFESFGQPKKTEELQKQVEEVNKKLGSNILPPEYSLENVEDIDILEIQEKYKDKYQEYLNTLRNIKKDELNTKEIRHAKEWIIAINNLDKYIKEHESQNDPLLRERQFHTYKEIRNFLEQGGRRGYVKLPAGVGKTLLFTKIIEAIGMKTIVASPTNIILDQNAKESDTHTDFEYGKYNTKNKDLDKKVIYTTYASLVNLIKNEQIDPDKIPVIILDEAHRALGVETFNAIEKFQGLILGFTATDIFSEDKKVANLLPEEIFKMNVADAIREGLLANTQCVLAHTNIDLSSVLIKNGEYNEKELSKKVNVFSRNKAALELYQKKFNGMQLLCNCVSVEHSKEMAKIFNENGVRAESITGQTSVNEREEILKKYKNGEIKVLTNAKVLLEGFNAPNCSVTFNLKPTLSLVDAEQRARSGRLDPNNPEKWNYVVDFIDQKSKKPQVLYSEILGGDRLWKLNKNSEKKEKEEISNSLDDKEKDINPKPPIDFNDFYLEDLRVSIETEDIMKITRENIDSREKWTFETLKTAVREAGIKGSRDYRKKSSEYGWPAVTTITSWPEFPKKADGSNDWEEFLG